MLEYSLQIENVTPKVAQLTLVRSSPSLPHNPANKEPKS